MEQKLVEKQMKKQQQLTQELQKQVKMEGLGWNLRRQPRRTEKTELQEQTKAQPRQVTKMELQMQVPQTKELES